MPLWQAAKLKLEVKPQTDIVVQGTNGRPLAIEGVTELFARDPQASFWKKLNFIVTRSGNWTLILLRDQKRLLLLSKTYPRFLGEGRQQRSLRTIGEDQTPIQTPAQTPSQTLNPRMRPTLKLVQPTLWESILMRDSVNLTQRSHPTRLRCVTSLRSCISL